MPQDRTVKQIYKLVLQPGVFRDYSRFSSPGCTDANWFRFFYGRLKKIGGFRWLLSLPAYTLLDTFEVNTDSPQGNPFTQPSYPAKQYSNQDLSQPAEATFITQDDVPYNSYNFTDGGFATFNNGNGLSDTGYRIPRKLLNVVLDGINKLIILADYYEENTEVSNYGGIGFCNLQSDLNNPQLVNGFFPSEFGYLPNTTYVWSLDYVTLTTGQEQAQQGTFIVCHPSSATGIADPTNRYVFIQSAAALNDGVLMSPLSSSTPVTTLEPPYATEVSVSGGVCAVGPFLFAYGNNGLIRNSDANNPLKWANPGSPEWQFNPGLANDVNVCNSKIVKGFSVRGLSTYAALFWALDCLILATFVGAPTVFSYTIIANNISIIAANSVVERTGDFFWLGDGRFFVWSGGKVSELENQTNREWFFSNINPQYQHLAYGFLNPEFTEVWWCFPFGSSTECNHAIIYNYQLNCWYDTPLERGAGVYSSVLNRPLLSGNVLDLTTNSYDIYVHEDGVNHIDKNGNGRVIPGSFTTGNLSMMSSPLFGSPKSNGDLVNNFTELERIELDGVINGTWTITIEGVKFALSREITKYTSPPLDMNTLRDGRVDVRYNNRIMYLTMSSNSLNNSFYQGDIMFTADVTDGMGY